jgi:hypothetical protein
MTFFSFRPKDFSSSESAGMNDIVLTIRDPRFVIEEAKSGVSESGAAYNIPEQLAVKLFFEYENHEPVPWTIQAGLTKFAVPTKNGFGIMKPDGTPTKLSSKSDLAEFITALLKSGMPEDLIPTEETGVDGPAIGIRFLDGVSFHNLMEKKTYKGKDGAQQQKKNDSPVPVKFIGKDGGTPKGGNGSVTSATTSSASSSDDDILSEIICDVVNNAPAPFNRIELNAGVQKAMQARNMDKQKQVGCAQKIIKGDILKALADNNCLSIKDGLYGRL